MNTLHPAATIGWLLSGVAIQLLVIGMLWLYPGILARFAAGRSSHELLEISVSSSQLQYIAFSVLGAWFALQGAVYLSYQIVQSIQFAFENLPSKTASMGAEGIRLICGVALMMGARGLVGALNRIRGRMPQTVESGSSENA